MRYSFDEVIDRCGHNSAKWGEAYIGTGEKQLLPFWVADTDFRAPVEVNEALRACVEHGIYGYDRPSASCRAAAASWQERRNGFCVDPEWITFLPGIDCALAAAIQAFTDSGDRILINTPIYDPFFEMPELNGRQTVDSPMVFKNGKYEFDLEDFARKAQGCKLWLFCNPQNPEGRCFTASELQEVADICLRYGIRIVSDEIHGDIIYDGRKHISIATLSEPIRLASITCTSPSKTFSLAGMSASVIVIPDRGLRESFQRAVARNSAGIGVLGLTAMEAAYKYGDEYADQVREYLQGNRDFAMDYFQRHIPSIHPVCPEATFLMWLDCTGLGLASDELEPFFIQAGVRLSMGSAYREPTGQFARLNFGCARQTLEKGLVRIQRAVEERRKRKYGTE